MFQRMTQFSVALSICFLTTSALAGAQTALPAGNSAQAAAQSAPAAKAPVPTLAVEQIIQKNVEARGGLAAWRAIQSMTETGKMDANSKGTVQLPFKLEMMRPRKTRLEIVFNGHTAVQTYDGTNGWTLRPYLGRPDPDPYSEIELRKSAEQQELDGPLVDYAAKGTTAELVGVEQVEGKDAYKIRLTLKTKAVRHIWIDARSFLELKIEDMPRILDGKPHNVDTYFRDYRPVSGLMIPFTLETAVKDVVGSKKLIIEKVELNPKLDDMEFAKPQSLPPGALMGRGISSGITSVPPIKR